jgi:hypothetical protein
MREARSRGARYDLAAAKVIESLIQEAAFAGYGGVGVSPHEFAPLKRWRNRGRCRICLAHEEIHPALGWLPSRPLFDDREAIRVG